MAHEKRTLSGDVPLMTTTLWDFRSQNYRGGLGRGKQGDPNYVGATPSYVIWNLLQRYTREKWLVVDPMCGSGTTLDVARDLGRKALGYDVRPVRDDIFRVDARALPLEDNKADFVFVDPPYSNHIKYSGQPDCIGELDARKGTEYYLAMEKVILEIHRVLKPERHMALYVSDSARKGSLLEPIGFKLFAMLNHYFVCEDIVVVARHNKTLMRQNWHSAAAEGNFFLRGFNYLFIMYKPKEASPRRARTGRNTEPRKGRAAEGRKSQVRAAQKQTTSHKPSDESRSGARSGPRTPSDRPPAARGVTKGKVTKKTAPSSPKRGAGPTAPRGGKPRRGGSGGGGKKGGR